MERASTILGRLRFSSDGVRPEEMARAAWPLAVGKKIAAHARAARLVRSKLIVEVDDRIWQRQLFVMTQQIVQRLERTLGRRWVEDIEFRVTPARRGPQRAEAINSVADNSDEADRIADPVMRRIYKDSRKKALA